MSRVLLTLTLACIVAGCAAPQVKNVAELDRYQTTVTTDDGWTLAVFRVPPAPGTEAMPGFGVPVLMPHGTSVNRFNYMTPGSDLAGYLSRQGYDVWVPEHRGDRSSRSPDPKGYRSGDWSIDDIADHDIPAVLDLVLRETKQPQVWWVGHSLGGILGYITAQSDRSPQVAGLVTIGSPGAYVHPSRWVLKNSRHTGLLPKSGQVPTRGAGKALVPVLDVAPDSRVLHVIFNLDNVDLPTLMRFTHEGMENIGRGMTEQYLSWLQQGDLTSRDGARNWTRGLSSIRQPAFVIAGRVDHIVPAWTARYGYEQLGSQDKTWQVMGVGWGHRADYGHGDLLVGRNVEVELFPLIGGWLDARVGAATATPASADPWEAPASAPASAPSASEGPAAP